ncbi:ABC transporter permease subunit [Halomonas sp. PAMB 3264]|uniref:ABC transporter permease subunit n=1 Tax=unclassified Halomonas TaxID=2609666 RepID=UPI00289EB19C|nr:MULTISPECIES: ABC transporter permease subunit [unclassified Halomonas]WNL39024.1 ABC transporter permease subunit [Halomonas sp. PAMB 3232]WNL42374.1 ABC transporter permease subunit [Halomonas sp. PAMB 3264]
MTPPSPAPSSLRTLKDRIATGLITAAGIGVLLAILAIGVFLVWETLPLLTRFESLSLETLSPLAWGTLKAAIAALVLAVPVALGAAIFSALFMTDRLRARIKPSLELMEAVPGVVIGFVAGLVLAPWVERHLASTLALLLWLPLSAGLAGILWHLAPKALRRTLSLESAGLWLLPWIAAMAALALWAAPLLEQQWLGSDLATFLDRRFGIDYTTRNTLIVGLAMGFAIIPSVYSLAEDALYDIPRPLMEGAQALGASRWQALWKVALPMAGPGIFSAVMIGAGRAVGETMIVLMASSNAALMSASLFEGLRSFSAAIAIELPEAPPDGQTYHLLIFAALVLFLFTFLVNTLAEVVRQRLRRRYQRLGGA